MQSTNNWLWKPNSIQKTDGLVKNVILACKKITAPDESLVESVSV